MKSPLADGCTDPTAELSALQQEFTTGPSAPSNFSEGAQHSVRCRIGYFWLDGSSLKTVSCISYHRWNVTAACICKFGFKIIDLTFPYKSIYYLFSDLNYFK